MLYEVITIGVGLRYFSLGQIDFRDDQGTNTGFGKPNEFEISVAYARKLSDKFSAVITSYSIHYTKLYDCG